MKAKDNIASLFYKVQLTCFSGHPAPGTDRNLDESQRIFPQIRLSCDVQQGTTFKYLRIMWAFFFLISLQCILWVICNLFICLFFWLHYVRLPMLSYKPSLYSFTAEYRILLSGISQLPFGI